MPALQLHYRHNHHHEPHYNSKTEIQQLAMDVRRQLDMASTRRLTLAQLASVEELTVNRVTYELWVDIDHDVHDERGNDVLGVFEYTPQSSIDAVSVCVSPTACDRVPEVMLSTFAHEMGHAIYDGPALVVQHQNQPLETLVRAEGKRAYRMVTESQAHFQPPQDSQLSKVEQFAEFRANEFMGSLLVPQDLLWDAVLEEAPKQALATRYADSLFGPTPDGIREIVWTTATYDVDLRSLARAVAPHFGVTPTFIEVRMKRYGIIPSDEKPN